MAVYAGTQNNVCRAVASIITQTATAGMDSDHCREMKIMAAIVIKTSTTATPPTWVCRPWPGTPSAFLYWQKSGILVRFLYMIHYIIFWQYISDTV